MVLLKAVATIGAVLGFAFGVIQIIQAAASGQKAQAAVWGMFTTLFGIGLGLLLAQDAASGGGVVGTLWQAIGAVIETLVGELGV